MNQRGVIATGGSVVLLDSTKYKELVEWYKRQCSDFKSSFFPSFNEFSVEVTAGSELAMLNRAKFIVGVHVEGDLQNGWDVTVALVGDRGMSDIEIDLHLEHKGNDLEHEVDGKLSDDFVSFLKRTLPMTGKQVTDENIRIMAQGAGCLIMELFWTVNAYLLHYKEDWDVKTTKELKFNKVTKNGRTKVVGKPNIIIGKQYRLIGTVRTKNVPKCRQWKISEWGVRGHYRTLQSGKVVPVKPCVKKRKGAEQLPVGMSTYKVNKVHGGKRS